MKKLKKVIGWFITCFGVQKPVSEVDSEADVIVSEFRTKEEFAETMRKMDLHDQRARSRSLPNSWVLGNRS